MNILFQPEALMNTTDEVFQVELPPVVLSKGQREAQAFRRLLPELLKTHKGLYVAIHDGQVVESGPDQIAVIKAAFAKVGYVPIHVGLVTEEPPFPERYRHYRELREDK